MVLFKSNWQKIANKRGVEYPFRRWWTSTSGPAKNEQTGIMDQTSG